MTFLLCLLESKEFEIERPFFFSSRETMKMCTEKLFLADQANKTIPTQ
jgi:hypothetical protein